MNTEYEVHRSDFPRLPEGPFVLVDLGHLEGGAAAWLTTFAPILISLSFKLVSDQSLIGSGVTSVRRKLPRLRASA
jgi:hypothetical protein